VNSVGSVTWMKKFNINIFLVVVQQEKRIQCRCIGMCRMQRFLAVLRSVFYSSLLYVVLPKISENLLVIT